MARHGKALAFCIIVIQTLVPMLLRAFLLQPHLGTDRLIGILRAFRAQLLALGVHIQWGTAVRSLDIRGSGSIAGVHLEGAHHPTTSGNTVVLQWRLVTSQQQKWTSASPGCAMLLAHFVH
jgi:hypothetical protein